MFKIDPLELCDHYGQSTAYLFDGEQTLDNSRRPPKHGYVQTARPARRVPFYQHCVRKNKRDIPAIDILRSLEPWALRKNKAAFCPGRGAKVSTDSGAVA